MSPPLGRFICLTHKRFSAAEACCYLVAKLFLYSSALLLGACSFIAPRTTSVRVVADNSQAVLYANGVEIGRGSAVVNLPCNRRATFSGMLGDRRTDIVVDRELSSYGIADLAGGCCLIIPFIGFCSPGAWQLTQDTVPLHIPSATTRSDSHAQ